MSSSNVARAGAPARLLSKLERRDVNVGNGERIASALTGGSLIAYGLTKRGIPGTVAGLLGGVLLVRGATGHCDVYAALGHSSAGPGPGLRLRHAITVNAPPEELYRFWRQLENLPRFMKHLKDVRRTGPLESHWVAVAPTGQTIEWDARIVAEEEGRFLAWESLPDSDVVHRGSVRFRRAAGGRGSVVELDIRYEPLAGKLRALFATVFGKGAEMQIREDLRRFKQILETGEIATSEGPSGRASSRARDAERASGGERSPERVAAREPELAGVPS